MRIKTGIKDFWRRNSIAIVHMPFLLVLLFASYVVLRALDPRIGLEGFGDLFGYLLNSVRAAIIIFTAWWFKNNAWHDINAKAEDELFHLVRQGDPGAFKAKVLDRVEWAFLLVFFAWLMMQ
jgi:hypothetical protein